MDSCEVPKDLFVRGTLYFVKRDVNSSSCTNASDSYILWKREPDEHFQRVQQSGNMYSNYKCDSHLYVLRDVLKGLPRSADRTDLYAKHAVRFLPKYMRLRHCIADFLDSYSL
ncbi:hypothetical protein GIB67_020597 [Kingdonia uniflora]|uniref:Uncharacterized protein n=1 Tax=Kingdonia uniflora TaxID=39325 RepID=A0A7J7M8R7_9MAGN|nr:hypothetical protein GIB67_020597 [Kingdonia uniflora]